MYQLGTCPQRHSGRDLLAVGTNQGNVRHSHMPKKQKDNTRVEKDGKNSHTSGACIVGAANSQQTWEAI